MKIAVCVKHVPEGRAALDRSALRIDRSGPGTLNAYDAIAIEAALRTVDPDGEIVLISMGPAGAVDSLRKGLAMGAHRAVLVSDEAAEGSDLLATSTVLARVIAREQPDLALFGQQSPDGDGALLGAAVAEDLRWPVISQASSLTVSAGTAEVRRQIESGHELLRTPLPAVIAVSDTIGEARRPPLAGIVGARRKPLETVALGELGLEPTDAGGAGSRTEVLALAAPPARGAGLRIGADADGAQAIVDYLAEIGLI